MNEYQLVNSENLVKLIRAHAAGDNQQFEEVATTMALQERKRGHAIVATRLLDAIESPGLVAKPVTFKRSKLKNPNENQNWTLEHPSTSLDSLQFNQNQKEAIEAFRDDLVTKGKMAKFGFNESPRALFYGPPGTGKTESAKAIAKSSMKPLLTVSLESLVSSYLGETSTRLAEVFKEAENQGAILFIDELDAIARERDDTKENGELKRVVIALLQLLDKTQETVPVIAATNHSSSLDRAIWRRFLDHIRFDLPESKEREKILIMTLPPNTQTTQSQIEEICELTPGWSGADLKTLARHAARQAIRQNRPRIEFPDLQEALLLMKNRRTGISHRPRNEAKIQSQEPNSHLAKRNKEIVQLYDSGSITQEKVGNKYGLKQPTIQKIIAREKNQSTA
jgi:SpoVK/Ycf46/Vps4 family AAA+-type ATPase